MTRTIYMAPGRAQKAMLAGRAILSRVPGLLLILGIVWLFYRDPVWPYSLMTSGPVSAFIKILTDSQYRTTWIEHYGLVVIVLASLVIIMLVAFKLAIWNKVFKKLKVRTRDENDKVETELGRVYWIEDYSGRWAVHAAHGLLKALHIADVRVGLDPKKHYRTVREDASLELALSRSDGLPDFVPMRANAHPYKRRTIFYKANFWPPINPISPHRSMHRLIVEIPESSITTHDGTTVMVEGTNPKRDLSQDYPTFYLVSDRTEYVPLDVAHYKNLLDGDIKGSTYTTNIASQMDTFLLKDQRKFQEISVPVNPEMARLVREAKEANGNA